MAILDCRQIDSFFKLSEQAMSAGLDAKKMIPSNAYYGKVPDGEQFPLHSGTNIKATRLGRIGIPDGTGWRPIEDEVCSSNACSFEPDVMHHGSDSFYFSLAQKDLRTDWFCLDSLAFREMPEDEMANLENGLQRASRYVHEEFRRSRQLNYCANKILTLVDRVTGDPEVLTETCEDPINNGWIFEKRSNGEMNENYIRVCCANADIDLIASTSLDSLDYASENLEYEDEGLYSAMSMHDIILPSNRIVGKLALQENALMTGGTSNFNAGVELRQTYGITHVIRNYGFRNDTHAMRFYPDVAFNTALLAGGGYAFDQNDPETWPRFTRVYPYKPVKMEYGISFERNPNYLKAPFGIAHLFTPRVMQVMSFPNVAGVGSAKKFGGFGYDGTVEWQNPDWQCNVNRDKGFFKMRWRLAAKPRFTEEGYAWLVRIDRTNRINGVTCPIPEAACEDDVTPYCFEGMGGSVNSGLGTNAAIDEG